MCVARQLFELCDEFYMEISPLEKKRNQGLNLLMRKLRATLNNAMEGFSEEQERMLVDETIGDMDEVMDQVSNDEKHRNPKVIKLFDELQEHLAYIKSDFETGWDGTDWESDEDENAPEDLEDEDDLYGYDEDEGEQWD